MPFYKNNSSVESVPLSSWSDFQAAYSELRQDRRANISAESQRDSESLLMNLQRRSTAIMSSLQDAGRSAG